MKYYNIGLTYVRFIDSNCNFSAPYRAIHVIVNYQLFKVIPLSRRAFYEPARRRADGYISHAVDGSATARSS